MKLYKKLIIIIMLLCIFIYVCNITLLPNSVILIQGETLDICTAYGITINELTENNQIIQASSNLNKSKINEIGKIDLSLNLFGKIPLKI